MMNTANYGQQQGFTQGMMAPQPNYGVPAQQPNYGVPAQQPNYGVPAQQPNYGVPAQQPNYVDQAYGNQQAAYGNPGGFSGPNGPNGPKPNVTHKWISGLYFNDYSIPGKSTVTTMYRDPYNNNKLSPDPRLKDIVIGTNPQTGQPMHPRKAHATKVPYAGAPEGYVEVLLDAISEKSSATFSGKLPVFDGMVNISVPETQKDQFNNPVKDQNGKTVYKPNVYMKVTFEEFDSRFKQGKEANKARAKAISLQKQASQNAVNLGQNYGNNQFPGNGGQFPGNGGGFPGNGAGVSAFPRNNNGINAMDRMNQLTAEGNQMIGGGNGMQGPNGPGDGSGGFGGGYYGR